MDPYLIPWADAMAVAFTAAALYLLFVITVRALGQRVLTALTSLDVIVTISLGAVIGRAILGRSPDLASGVVAILSLFAVQALFSRLRRWGPTAQLVRNPPLALIADGELLGANLRRARLAPEDVWARLRLAGAPGPDAVAVMVLESSGQISVVLRGEPVDDRLLLGVAGLSDRSA